MPLPYTQGQVNAAAQQLQPMVTVQAPQTNVAVPATATQGQVVSANVDPMYREAQVANPNYNMPGSAEAYSRWGIPPVMMQRDPYATIAWQANGDGTVMPVVGFGSRYPHMVNGVPRQVGSVALGNLLGGLMNMANRFVPPLPVVRRSGGGTAKPAAPAKPAPAKDEPMQFTPEHMRGVAQQRAGLFAIPRRAVDAMMQPYNLSPTLEPDTPQPQWLPGNGWGGGGTSVTYPDIGTAQPTAQPSPVPTPTPTPTPTQPAPAPAQPGSTTPADTAAVIETLALAQQLQQVMGLA